MNKNVEHIILSILFRYYEKENTLAILLSKKESKKYGINLLTIIFENPVQAKNVFPSRSFLASIDISKQIEQITELQIFYSDRYDFQQDDDILYLKDSFTLTEDKPVLRYERDVKGYYAINTILSATFTEKNNLYHECFEHLRPRAENKKDSIYGTCKMLFKMYDELKPEMVLDWFKHDTPLIKQLRHTSPFVYSLRFVSKDEYFTKLREVVNNPQNYYPRPNYYLWLDEIIEKQQIGLFNMRYVPDTILDKQGIDYSNGFDVIPEPPNWKEQIKKWKEEMDSGNFKPIILSKH